MGDAVEVDARSEPAAEADMFLLTSDGLHSSLGEARMAELVCAHPDLHAAVSALLSPAAAAAPDGTRASRTFGRPRRCR